MPPARPTLAVDLRALVPEATGIGVSTRETLAGIARRERFHLLGLAHREPRGAAGLAELGVQTEHADGHPLAKLGVLWQQLLLPRRLERGDVDLLWSPLQTLPARCPVPAVVTVHDLTALLMPDAHRAKVRWSQVPFLAGSLARARRVVAVSRATADDLLFHFPQAFTPGAGGRGKLRVVHHGVAPSFRPPEPGERERIREELGLPRGFLLYAGTLEPRKNVVGVLDAWLALRADRPTAPPLVLAGGYGWRSKDLVKRIERIRRAGGDEARDLHVLGRVSDDELVRLYRGATLFLYPSFYEGFGMPVLEAMASGLPVVTSDRSSLPEVAGDAALRVRPEDAGQIGGAVRHLLDEPGRAEALAARGLERARGFRWERAAEEMEAVLFEALDGR